MSNTTQKGSFYEDIAKDFLQKRGLTLLSRNFRHRQGEIDLIMRHGGTVVFVEVRYRKQDSHGSAEESITYRKQKSIISTANYFLMKNKLWDTPCRFDVLTIKPSNKVLQSHEINWIMAAFD